MPTVATNTWPSLCGACRCTVHVGGNLYVGLERAVRRAKTLSRCADALVLPWKRAMPSLFSNHSIERAAGRTQADFRRNSNNGMELVQVSAQGQKGRFSHKFNWRTLAHREA